MGVSGCGKSTLSRLLSVELDGELIEADDYHSEENKMLMAKGIPLEDKNREPWLDALNKKIFENQQQQKRSILACSALKEKYREILSTNIHQFFTVFLDGSYGYIGKRLDKRKNHFFNPGLLESQFLALEVPESCWRFSIENFSSEEICAQILDNLAEAKGQSALES